MFSLEFCSIEYSRSLMFHIVFFQISFICVADYVNWITCNFIIRKVIISKFISYVEILNFTITLKLLIENHEIKITTKRIKNRPKQLISWHVNELIDLIEKVMSRRSHKRIKLRHKNLTSYKYKMTLFQSPKTNIILK